MPGMPEALEIRAGVSPEAEGSEVLRQQAAEVIRKMADLYERQVAAGVLTREQLQVIPDQADIPAWKKTAATMALKNMAAKEAL